MIGSLRGILLKKQPDHVLLEVNGIGYHINVSFHTISSLADEGSKAFLYIYTHVREDILQLFGFTSEDEKKIFIALLGISGIGPKMALNILSGISHEGLLSAIETEDVALLCRIPGLGKKTASRLILELREKLPSSGKMKNRVFEDTLSALINLGYKKSVAQNCLERLYNKEIKDIEGLLRESLKYLTGDVREGNR